MPVRPSVLLLTCMLIYIPCLFHQTGAEWSVWFNLRYSENSIRYISAEEVHRAYPNLMCKEPTAIDVKTVTGTPATKTNDTFYQFDRNGVICRQEDQEDNIRCDIYFARFCCPGIHGARKCLTEEEIDQYPMTRNDSVTICEDVPKGTAVFNLSDWTQFENTSIDIVGGNTYNRFGINENCTTVIVAGLLQYELTPVFSLKILLANDMKNMIFEVNIVVIDVESWPRYYNKTCEMDIREKSMFYPYPFDVKGFGGLVSERFKGHPKNMKGDLLFDTNNSNCAVSVYFPILRKYHGFSINKFTCGFTIIEGFTQIDNISLLEKDDLHSSDITRKIAAITNFETKTVGHTTVRGFNSHQRLLFYEKISLEITPYGRTVDFKGGQYEFLAIGCPAGQYGVPCEFDCVCMNGATCHVFNGACLCGRVRLAIYTLNLLCRARGSDCCDDILWFHNGREIKRSPELGVIQSRGPPRRTYILTINNLSGNHSGTYQCIARQQGPGNVISIPSNIINITVSDCEPGSWGPHCQYLCQCVHATNCTQYEGCVCEEGWDGDQCQTDIENPKISCPHDTTFLLEEHAFIDWPLPEISDNSNSVNTTSNYSPGDRMSTGKHLITYTAIDISGNTATCSFMLNIKDQSVKIPWVMYGLLLIGFIALTLIAILIVTVIVTKRRGPRYGNYTRMDMPKFVVPENVDSFTRTDVTISKTTLGCGQFANVYVGEINVCDDNPLAVAVKKMKGADDDYIRAFENEVKSLTILKDSEHIVNLIGILVDDDVGYILTELMSSDLKEYLIGRCFENDETMGKIADNLTDIALHVVRALQDMANKMIIHRDIAARNVLLYVSSKGVIAKLGDFGLGRQVYMTGKYRENAMESKYLPLAWMSLESLTEGVYTHKSDIWSYGILLWEMATLGGVPYSEIEHLNSRVLIKHLQLENNRLHKPRHCPEIMYSIMTSCWKANPNDRPDSNNIEKDILQCAKNKMGFFCDDEPREIGATWV